MNRYETLLDQSIMHFLFFIFLGAFNGALSSVPSHELVSNLKCSYSLSLINPFPIFLFVCLITS
jgi:hypothetical protein